MTEEVRAFRGRRVTLDPLDYPNLAGRVFTIIGAQMPPGSDAVFVAIADAAGRRMPNWVKDTELLPAPAPHNKSPLPSQREETRPMPSDILEAAARFENRVVDLANGRTMREAINLASVQDAEGAEAYRLTGVGAEVGPVRRPAPLLSLSMQPGESFDALVMRYADEKKLDLRKAIHEVAKARPDLAATR